jgi:hypothetical protein
VIPRIRDALGWVTGSLLAGVIIAAIVTLPVFVVLWLGIALGVRDAVVMHARITVWIGEAFSVLDGLLPAWAWFAVLGCGWLAFLDLHVRWLVRDELVKRTKAPNEKEDP